MVYVHISCVAMAFAMRRYAQLFIDYNDIIDFKHSDLLAKKWFKSQRIRLKPPDDFYIKLVGVNISHQNLIRVIQNINYFLLHVVLESPKHH